MGTGHGKKVLLAMSGGVDSSVAAALLKEDGYEVVGCFMRLGDPEQTADLVPEGPSASASAEGDAGGRAGRSCCSVGDAADARLIAAMLDIPLYVLNFRREFGRVIRHFVSEYNAGRTPNPCIRCNDWLKFGALMDHADTIDADYVATGHYARISPAPGSAGRRCGDQPRLLRGRDNYKDQSYVLFGTRRARLGRMILPLGEYEKVQIRDLARQLHLPVADKPDSQEICFVPNDDYAAFVRRHAPEDVRPGDILDAQGHRLGQHEGHQHFTIGQRRGVGVALGQPIYVTAKDGPANTITVGAKHDLLADGLIAGDTNWLIDPPTDAPLRCLVKIRYASPAVPATVLAVGADALEVRFEQPLSAVAPGQAAVCYDGDQVLGGGWIERSLGPADAPR